ncbi:hypothetical protein ODJ79_02335 [Actinoplanes sp. KI2]|uniref:hypothetical protein n=1 Tax=Actinoplanes sp. KI2 TaxID=2983315 RepID=UPI0021D5844D|nr:hypothetical protein [Actinoplanes sp. KI2]MCU7722544.1 hypothetical protein [Actinoplanes sp. KI2]
MGLEALAAITVAFLLRKAARIGARANVMVDEALDAGLDRLELLIRSRLGNDPALARLEQESLAGEPASDQSRQAITSAILRQAESDPHFAYQLESAVTNLQQIVSAAPHSTTAVGGRDAFAVTGDNNYINSPVDKRKYFGLGFIVNLFQSHPVVSSIVGVVVVLGATALTVRVVTEPDARVSGAPSAETASIRSTAAATSAVPIRADVSRMKGEWRARSQDLNKNGTVYRDDVVTVAPPRVTFVENAYNLVDNAHSGIRLTCRYHINTNVGKVVLQYDGGSVEPIGDSENYRGTCAQEVTLTLQENGAVLLFAEGSNFILLHRK